MSDGKKIGSDENQNNSPKKRTPNKKDSPNSKEKEAPKKPSVKKETVKEEQTSSHSNKQDEKKEKGDSGKKQGSQTLRSMMQQFAYFLCISLFSLFLIDILFSPNILSSELWKSSMSVSELSMSKGLTGLDYFIHSMLKALLICVAAIFFLVVVTIKFIFYALLYVLFYELFNFLFIFIILCFIDRSDILLFLEDTKKIVLIIFDGIWSNDDMPKKYYRNIACRIAVISDQGSFALAPGQTEENFKRNNLLFGFYSTAQLVIFIGIPILYMIIVWCQRTRGKRKLASLKLCIFWSRRKNWLILE